MNRTNEDLDRVLAGVDTLMRRCQAGVGGHRALDMAHSIMAECYGTLGALAAAVRHQRQAEELGVQGPWRVTRGPWHVFSNYAQHEIRTQSGDLVAVVQRREDAMKIAAVPKMLEILRSLYLSPMGQGDYAAAGALLRGLGVIAFDPADNAKRPQPTKGTP